MKRYSLPVLAVLVLVGIWAWLRNAPDQPLDPVGKVRLAASLTLSPAPLWVARDQGLFRHAGLEAEVLPCSTGKACTEAMLRGEADIAAAAEFLAARVSFRHPELRILGTTAFVHTIKLLALKDRGIAGPDDLRGHKVGVRLGTNGEYFLARLLDLNGLDRDHITWVDLKPQAMGEALATGAVDAVLVWPPFTQRIQARLGERILAFDGQPGQDYYYLLLSRTEWLAGHAAIAERVMLALKRAEGWLTDQPQAAGTYLAAQYGLAPADLDEALDNTRFSVGLPQTLLAALETEGRWLAARGTAGRRVEDILDLIAFRPLEAVAPQSITMVKGN